MLAIEQSKRVEGVTSPSFSAPAAANGFNQPADRLDKPVTTASGLVRPGLFTGLGVQDSTTGTDLQVVSFRFGWRKKEASDDIKTGKRKIIANFQAVDVYDSPRIPEAWQAEMKEYVQTKEELLFEAIIVQHPKTKKLYQAPPLFLKLL